jgi:uncharacterized protein YyaL (SSP411 family)
LNRLSNEKSAYLRHAASQKIDWYPWCEEAFERAREEDKPLFLSTGAVWCHWCHVMAKECFQDADIIRLLNENFISIKLDRDERPDIDKVYQQAVAAMGAGGGWPLSVFLTPDKKPFFGGTYFPPEDRFGRPGFKKVLTSVTGLYHSKREDIHPYTEKLIHVLQPKTLQQGEIGESYIENAEKTILSEIDLQHGGFGTAPKFPMSGATEFLLNRYVLTRKETTGFAIRKTLESMARGGFHDQIGGGFHRYSTDEGWIIPHFEKMADDNAWLLRNYITAYSVFGDDYLRKVAEGIIRFTGEVLSGPEGGFYASQDADVTPDDEGGYFTWTDEDLKNVLSDEEYRILSLHLFHEKGAMHHDTSKRVLFIAMDEKEIAEQLNIEVESVSQSILGGKEKLLAERNKRTTPFIDNTLYTSLNGMFITAYLIGFRVLGDENLKDFALRSLHMILERHIVNNELLHSEGVAGLLEDYIHIVEALIAAYEVTGDTSYLGRAEGLMDLCIEKFWDNTEGGFFETADELIGIRLKGIEDISHPSSNAIGIMVLLKLLHQTSRDKYYQHAEKALRAFSSRAGSQGVLSGYYFASLDAFHNMLKLSLQTTSSAMTKVALSSVSPYTSFVYGEDRDCVIPCMKDVCYEPVHGAGDLREFLKKQKYLGK